MALAQVEGLNDSCCDRSRAQLVGINDELDLSFTVPAQGRRQSGHLCNDGGDDYRLRLHLRQVELIGLGAQRSFRIVLDHGRRR